MLLGLIGQSSVVQTVQSKATVGEVISGNIEQIDFAFCIDNTLDSVGMDVLRPINRFTDSLMLRINQRLEADGLAKVQNMRMRYLLFQDYNQPTVDQILYGSTSCPISGCAQPLILRSGVPLIYTKRGNGEKFFSLSPVNASGDPQVEDFIITNGISVTTASTFENSLSVMYSVTPLKIIVASIEAVFLGQDGGDPDESALICMNEAMRSPWARSGDRNANGTGTLTSDAVPVVVMITPSDTKPLDQPVYQGLQNLRFGVLTDMPSMTPIPPAEPTHPTSPLPASPSTDLFELIDVPSSLSGLVSRWNNESVINQDRKALMLFTNVNNSSAVSHNDINIWFPMHVITFEPEWSQFLCGASRCYRGPKAGRTASWDNVITSFEKVYSDSYNKITFPKFIPFYSEYVPAPPPPRAVPIAQIDAIYQNLKQHLQSISAGGNSGGPRLIK